MRLLNRFSIVFIIFVLLLVACGGKPEAAGDNLVPTPAPIQSTQSVFTASLSEIAGGVLARTAQEPAFSEASNGYIVQVLGQVQTQTDGRSRLDFSSGSLVRLGPNTLFTLQQPEENSQGLLIRVRLEVGRLWVILQGGSLEVETKSGVAAVRGSYMSVSYDPDSGETRITCLEGNCSLTTTAGSVQITAGQTAIVTGANQPPQVGNMDDQDVQEWLNNNPEAAVVVPDLTETPLDQASPAAPTAIPTAVIPTQVVVLPPVAVFPAQPTPIKKPTNPPSEPSPEPSLPPALPPSLVPTAAISGVSPTPPVVVGEPITVVASILPSLGGPTPTGTVQILADGVPICAASLVATGTATCTGSISNVGLHNLVADYLGDANYLPAQSAAQSISVDQGSTTTTIQSQTPNPSLYNTAVVFIATVDNVLPAAGLPTGSVTFTDGTSSCTKIGAPWTCSITFPSDGSKTVTATYSGDANFKTSTSAPVTQDVLPSSDTQFSNFIGPNGAILASNAECNQAYRITALDVNGISEVNIEYKINDNTLSAPVVSVPWTNITPGTLTIPANGLDTIYWRFAVRDGGGVWTYYGGGLAYTSGNGSYSFSLGSTVTCP